MFWCTVNVVIFVGWLSSTVLGGYCFFSPVCVCVCRRSIRASIQRPWPWLMILIKKKSLKLWLLLNIIENPEHCYHSVCM